MILCGDRLRQAREALGYSQAELAAKLGVSRGMVGHYETGLRVPSNEVAEAMATTLGVPLSWLEGGDLHDGTSGAAERDQGTDTAGHWVQSLSAIAERASPGPAGVVASFLARSAQQAGQAPLAAVLRAAGNDCAGSFDVARLLNATNAESAILSEAACHPALAPLVMALRDASMRNVVTGERLPRDVVRIAVTADSGAASGIYYVPLNALPRVLRASGVRQVSVAEASIANIDALSAYGAELRDGMGGQESGGQESDG